MSSLQYYSDGKLIRLRTEAVDLESEAAAARPARRSRSGSTSSGPGTETPVSHAQHAMQAVQAQHQRLAPLFNDLQPDTRLAVLTGGAAECTVLLTETLVLESPNQALLRRLSQAYGVRVVLEGSHGKVLLRAPQAGLQGVVTVIQAARDAYEHGDGRHAAHPNFIRILRQRSPTSSGRTPLWNHLNRGNPGVRGADVAAHAAWTISQGEPSVRVAILDEGVDTRHPALRAAVVAEADFVAGQSHARPDGNDAHGTACAGIVLSRSKSWPGLASGCSLVAARIAKGDGQGGWVFDDFHTADAVDWCWSKAQAAVLSNSWGGGPPADAISNAFDRARRQGRGGLGAVVVCATGNDNGPVGFPATMDDVLSVGASTPWDERKSPSTADGENWGSNFGPSIDLLAPGVWIACADIRGKAGYSNGNYTQSFNGTSAAAPHAAAGAALVLSVAPLLGEAQVRQVLSQSCDKLPGSNAWNRFEGHGRLNLHAALRLALRSALRSAPSLQAAL